MAVLTRTVHAAQRSVFLDEQMLVGRGDVDDAVARSLAVHDLLRRKHRLARKDLRDETLPLRRDVDDEKDRSSDGDDALVRQIGLRVAV